TNNSALVVNRNNAITVAAAIGGTGSLTQSGTGTTSLTGTNTYSGATAISAGTLRIGAGGATGTLGTGDVTIDAGATLAFNRNDTDTVSNTITGAGTLSHVGSGTTTLTAAINSVGATTVTAGTLDVDTVLETPVINMGSGVLNIDGTVQATGATQTSIIGVAAGASTINVNAGATLRANGDLGDGVDQLTLVGNLDTGGATFGFGDGDDRMRLHDTAVANAVFDAGTGTSDRLTLAGSGSGTLDVGTIGATGTYRNFEDFRKEESGTWTLTGSDLLSLGWTVSAGTLVANTISLQGNVTNNSAVIFDQSVAGTYAGTISGTGSVTKLGAGVLTLSGANTYSGSTLVSAGTLAVDGSLGSTPVSVQSGATLGGVGTIAGPVTIESGGTLAPGLSPGTLTVGALNLLPGSILDYELATAGVVGSGINDLVIVTGDLTLDGTLNVSGLSGFGVGTYRLIDYGGAFTDNDLGFGMLPVGYSYQLNAASPGQVNLVVSLAASDPVQYWDGAGPGANGVVNGGSGVWTAGAANWTNAAGFSNQAWGGQAAVFGGAGGTVTVEGQIDVAGLSFASSYAFAQGPAGELNTATTGTLIHTDSGVTAAIGVPIVGSGGLYLEGSGLVTLTAANSYAGGTHINGGALSVSSDANLGAASGSLSLNGAMLQTTGDLTSARSTTLGSGGGTFDTVGGTTFHLAGGIEGAGGLTKAGAGVLMLTGDNSYSGGTVVRSGTLQIGDCGTSGRIEGDIRNDSALVFSRADTTAVSGSISGSGSLIKTCTGTLVLTGANSYSGGTLISSGIVQGDTRSLQGGIVDNAELIFDQRTDGAFDGTLFGTGTVTKTGAGMLRLTGAHGVQGTTFIDQGTLKFDGTVAGGVVVKAGGAFDATGAIGGSLTSDGLVVGNLRVGGNVAFNPGSQYRTVVDAAGSNFAIVTPGQAAIDRATIVVDPISGDYGRVTQYAALHAASGLSGSATVRSLVPTLEPYLSQDSATLFVTLLRLDLPLQDYATGPAGAAASGALDRAKAGATGDLARVVRELTALEDAGLGVALEEIGGEIHASATQLAAMDGEAVTDLVRGEISNRIAASETRFWNTRHRRRTWFHLMAERSSLDAGPVHGGHASLQGLAMGTDWSVGQGWLVGVGGSYADGRLLLDGVDESSEFSSPRAISYIGYARDRWGVDGGVSVARAAYEARRRLYFMAIAPTGKPLFGGVDREAASTPSGYTADFWGEGRVKAMLGSWNIQPSAGVRHSHYGLASWEEAGAGGLSLGATAQSIASTQADAGVRLSRNAGRFQPFFSTSYRRELGTGRTARSVAFLDAPGDPFDIEGLRFARDSAAGQIGFTLMNNAFGVSVWYEGRRARQQTRHIFQLALGFE
ncbi:MAG: autotransporter-associated beta strand repeat-containing protein, partial [Vicinamibacterales bacterium]|nr:autotransporter-associated beta strand repeat-containing protein [Vicinamibacterales bacterium]